MGSADGRVIGLTKIVDAGSPERRWNLVIVADGYRTAELAGFANDARALANRLFATAPFSRADIRAAINVYRLDVESTQSGADKPNCRDGGGNGSAVATYFNGTFCFDGKTQRLLYGDDELVRSTVEKHLPQWHQILVLVKDSERGGGGGAVGWLSNGGTDWQDVALHEMGHSAFGLADEYDYDNGDRWTGGEPAEPNVTAEPDPSRVKWRTHVTAGAASPTRRNPKCSLPAPGPPLDPPGTVGTFEGARYHSCGSYRPVWNCKMRQTHADFCPVCQAEIVRTLMPFLQP